MALEWRFLFRIQMKILFLTERQCCYWSMQANNDSARFHWKFRAFAMNKCVRGGLNFKTKMGTFCFKLFPDLRKMNHKSTPTFYYSFRKILFHVKFSNNTLTLNECFCSNPFKHFDFCFIFIRTHTTCGISSLLFWRHLLLSLLLLPHAQVHTWEIWNDL